MLRKTCALCNVSALLHFRTKIATYLTKAVLPWGLKSFNSDFLGVFDVLSFFSPQVSSNKLMDNLLSLVDFPKLDRYVFIYFRPLVCKGLLPLFKRILFPKDTVLIICKANCQLSIRTPVSIIKSKIKDVNFCPSSWKIEELRRLLDPRKDNR